MTSSPSASATMFVPSTADVAVTLNAAEAASSTSRPRRKSRSPSGEFKPTQPLQSMSKSNSTPKSTQRRQQKQEDAGASITSTAASKVRSSTRVFPASPIANTNPGIEVTHSDHERSVATTNGSGRGSSDSARTAQGASSQSKGNRHATAKSSSSNDSDTDIDHTFSTPPRSGSQQNTSKKRNSIKASPKRLGMMLSGIFSRSGNHSARHGSASAVTVNASPDAPTTTGSDTKSSPTKRPGLGSARNGAAVAPTDATVGIAAPNMRSPAPEQAIASRRASAGVAIPIQAGVHFNTAAELDSDTDAYTDVDADEQQSVAEETVHSLETIKASNRHYLTVSSKQKPALAPLPNAPPPAAAVAKTPTKTKGTKKGWQRKLKQLVSRSSNGNGNAGSGGSGSANNSKSLSSSQSITKHPIPMSKSAHVTLGAAAASDSLSLPGQGDATPARTRVLSEDDARTWTLQQRKMQAHARLSASSASLQAPVPFRGSARSQSFETSPQRAEVFKLKKQAQLDLAIRGRLDGVDALSLGSQRRVMFPPKMAEPRSRLDGYLVTKRNIAASDTTAAMGTSDGQSEALTPDNSAAIPQSPSKTGPLDPLGLSFSGARTAMSPRDIVNDMVWTSEGKDQPEVVFEGYRPGGGDRWIVRLEPSAIKHKPSLVQRTADVRADASSTNANGQSPSAKSANLIVVHDGERETGPNGMKLERRDITKSPQASPTATDSTSDSQTDDGISENTGRNGASPNTGTSYIDVGDPATIPLHTLWDQMWGKDRPPPRPGYLSPSKSCQSATNPSDSDPASGDDVEEYDEVLALAASCNVPIDLDDDTFIIDGPTHLRSVHDLASVPLQQRRFDTVLEIFNKLLGGLRVPSNAKRIHLVGATHHNIGIVHSCKGDYENALSSFRDAVITREQCLPPGHPDIVVSLMRKGMAEFALLMHESALASFQRALGFVPASDATKAKILNNIGVVHFFNNKLPDALRAFTFALEIQRQWLDTPVRRESIVFGSSVTLGNMGIVYLARADYDLAFYVYEEACLLLTSSFRKDHDIVLSSLMHLAISKAKNENYDNAIRLFQGIMRSQQSRFGDDSPEVTESTGMIGYLYIKSVNFQSALECLNKVQQWQTKHLAMDHTSRKMTRDTIQAIEKCLQGSASMWV